MPIKLRSVCLHPHVALCHYRKSQQHKTWLIISFLFISLFKSPSLVKFVQRQWLGYQSASVIPVNMRNGHQRNAPKHAKTQLREAISSSIIVCGIPLIESYWKCVPHLNSFLVLNLSLSWAFRFSFVSEFLIHLSFVS